MKMKNYIYSIGLLLAMLLLAGCTDTDLQETQQAGSDADKVYLRIGLTMPEAQTVQSRSFDRVDDPSHSNFAFKDLHVAVFVQQGNSYILEEFVSAEGDNLPTWDGDASQSDDCPESGHWDFGVNLTKREGPRRLHFIANYPGLTMGFGEESGLIGRLLTDETLDAEGGHDIYWNYMDVPSIQDGTQALLRNIPMLRNFAKVEIKLTPKQDVNLNGKFKLTGYAIHNRPKKGTAAPYNSANGEFANYVLKNGTSMSCQTYENLEKEQGYVGNEPYDNEYQKLTEKDFNAVTYSDGTITAAPFYLYERTHVGADDPTCIILKGKYAANGNFNDAQDTYYKLDFVHRDENTSTNVYYNLLRNFIYTMNIVDVSGAGYNTVDDAIKNPASNNIAGNTDIEKFTNISDGDARLFVSTTYVVFTDEEPIDIYYQYIPDLKNNPTVHNNNLQGISGGEIVVSSTPTGEVLASAVVADSDETAGHVGWRKITLTPESGFDGRKVEYLTIASSTLQRKITIVRRELYPMIVDVYNPNDPEKGNLVAKTAKSEVDVKVSIEGGIPEALFPLKFYVTSAQNSIYAKPGGDMYSESYSGGYGFVKEITYDFYKNANATGKDAEDNPVGIKESDGKISFICNFLTNCKESATDVYVDNEYFNRGTDGFDNEWKPSVTIGTSILVDIQKNNGRYPYNIFNDGSNNGTRSVSFTYNGQNYSLTIDRDNVTTASTLTNNSGIDPSTVLTFTFEDKYYAGGDNWSTENVTYTATCTIRQLINGTKLKFTASTPTDVVFTTDANIGVQIQKSNFRYPKAINDGVSNYGIATLADGDNDGTETVTVKFGEEQVGQLTIDKDRVISNIELYKENGFNNSDQLIFTFEDQYYTNDKQWSGVNNKATYSATCTIQELKAGTTLNFISAQAPTNPETLVITRESFSSVSVDQESKTYTQNKQNKTVDVYPLNIFAGTRNNSGYYINPKNDGTETVTVYLNGELIANANMVIGKESIQSINDQLNGSIVINARNLKAEDTIEFRFTDEYCDRVEYKSNSLRYFFNQSGTYKSGPFTIEQLHNGSVELHFEH